MKKADNWRKQLCNKYCWYADGTEFLMVESCVSISHHRVITEVYGDACVGVSTVKRSIKGDNPATTNLHEFSQSKILSNLLILLAAEEKNNKQFKQTNPIVGYAEYNLISVLHMKNEINS